jgi:hypothetical protein
MDSGDAAFDNEIPGSVARDKAEQENHASGQDGGRFSNLEL